MELKKKSKMISKLVFYDKEEKMTIKSKSTVIKCEIK